MKTNHVKTLVFMGLALAATGVMAGTEPIQLSLTPDIAIFDKTERIEGLTLNIWGENPQSALALGFVNGSTGESAGLSWSLFLNYVDSYTGVQWALVNYTETDFVGWQGGLVNYTKGSMKGLQTGVVNYAGKMTGLQLGLVNYAAAVESGVQIGLVNIIPENQWFSKFPGELAPGMILVNWHF
jgi:hypothetical protein